MMRSIFPAAVVLSAATVVAAAEFRGRLDPQPALGTSEGGSLIEAAPELVARLPALPADGSRVWTTRRPFVIKEREFAFAVVELPDAKFTLWIDRDRDGRFGEVERWPFPSSPSVLALTLPWDNGIYREFPLEISVWRRSEPAATSSTGAEAPSYRFNFNVLFGTNVDLDGRELRITFAPRPWESAINLGTSRISMDANFNGRMEAALGEAENPSGKSPVFRVGARYLAVRSVDMATGEVIVEERPASDYTRFDARPGQEMPDFSFTTFDGVTRKLSDLRGRHVLLDFWGTWCGPCIAEMKHLDPLYAKYRDRGFEVIGMNMEKTSGGLTPEAYAKDEEKVRAFLAKAGHQWLQATQRSIERVAIDVIHVNSYPTCILLGPDGKVISREARGAALEKMLAQAFP